MKLLESIRTYLNTVLVQRTGGLIGRQAEAARLSRVLTEDTERAVVVSGEPGIGKTSLLEHVGGDAAGAGWQVVRVLGVEAEQPFALGGLNQLAFGLKAYQSGLDEADRTVLAPVFGGAPDSVVVIVPMASSVLNLLSVAAHTRPVLLVVDDVQWLDTVSAQVLGAVGRRLSGPGVRIVAGRRIPSESEFSSAGWADLQLGPLGSADSGRLLDRAGMPLTAAARTAILAAAQGNPLALAELPIGADQIENSLGTLPLTERLLAVFGGRLEALDAGVRADVLRAALDGTGANTAPSARTRYVMGAVQPAIAAGLLTVNQLGDSVFRHPLVRAAVIHQADPQQRRDAHRDLAALYHDVLVRRAAHLAAATTEPDQDVADLLAEAAKLSTRRGGLSVAVQWLRRAAELSTDADRRTAVIADAIFLSARADQRRGADELLEIAATTEGDSALTVLADCYQAFHADGEVIWTHRRILDALAGPLDDKTLNRLVYLLISITNYAGTAPYREQTNAALMRVNARLDPAVSLYRTGVDDFAGTANTVRAMLRDYVTLLPKVPAQRMVLLSFPAYCAGVMSDFRAPLQAAFTQLCENGASVDAIECGRVLLLDLIATGHWAQAEQVGATCLQMATQIECSQLRRHQLLADLGVLAAGRGDLQTARRYAAEVRAWSTRRGLHRLVDGADRIEVRVALAEGDYEAAYQAAIRISPPGHGTLDPSREATLYTGAHELAEDMLDSVEAALHTGRLEEARAIAARAVLLNLAEVSPRSAALSIAISAMTAPETDAGELYRSALTHPGIAEFPFEHARIALAYGMWLRRQQQPTLARSTLGLAAEGFDRLGARPWVDRAHAELRAAGAHKKRSPGGTVELSPQELRVAEYAATGHTTKEIAARLNLSPRTVEAHLNNAFRKLGVTRRAGLARALQDHESTPPSAADGDRGN